jgi:glycosidase
MKITPEGDRFWLQIDGLVAGQEYAFQYLIDGQIRLADPYADKILDPNNDPYIDEETYPGLMDYPYDKTSGLASVLQTAQLPYDWQVEQFQPAKTTDLVIYELLVRDFTEKHTYASIIDTLDYLAGMGINALELMPVNEFEGNIGWGYNPSFYFAPDKYYGPKNELKRLVDECHNRGIAVILDMVLNHAYDQCTFVQMYFDGDNPTSNNPWFNVQSNFQNPDAQWGNDFNHESLQTQALVDSVNSYWMSEYKMDGFRFDFTKGFSNNMKGDDDPWGSKYDADRIRLLERMTDEIEARNPNAIIIFEHLSDNSEEKELANYGIKLWGNLNYNYAEAAMGYNESGKSDFSWISYQKRGWDDPNVVGYMESHDEERVTYKCVTWGAENGEYSIQDTTIALQRMALDALFFLTIPGPKMIWQFGEMGYDYSINWPCMDESCRLSPKPPRWDYLYDYRRKYLKDFYGALIHLRTTEDAFETENYTLNVSAAMKRIILVHESMDVVIVGNFDVKEGTIIPGFTHTGSWYDYFTGEPLEVTNISSPISLVAGEYHLYTDKQLAVPDIGTGITGSSLDDGLPIQIYPNPSNGRVRVSLELNDQTSVAVNVYDLAGKKIYSQNENNLNTGQHQLDVQLPDPVTNGMYFLEVTSEEGRGVSKLVVN